MDARITAFRVLSRVERDAAYSNLALFGELNRSMAGESDENLDADRRLATELVYGVLRNRRMLDVWLAYLAERPPAKIDPAVRHVLRLALYQLLHLDRMPQHAVLSESGRILRKTKRKHAVGFVNALLRRFLREQRAGNGPALPEDPFLRLALLQSIPDWILLRWKAEEEKHTDDSKRLLGRLTVRVEQANRPAPLVLAVNPLKSNGKDLIRDLAALGAEARTGENVPEAVQVLSGGIGPVLPLIEDGRAHVMDEAAQLVVDLLGPEEGENILDLCAAPGGKSLVLAGRVGSKGRVLSVDLSEAKLKLLAEQARRHGFGWIETEVRDATEPWPGELAGSFDRILIDAPCTALGVLRRHPEIRWRRKESDVAEMAHTAREIAVRAQPLLKPGGVLVFSVCTTTAEEGPNQFRKLLDMGGWTPERPPGVAEGLWRTEGGLEWMDTFLDPRLDGFTAFRLRKSS